MKNKDFFILELKKQIAYCEFHLEILNNDLDIHNDKLENNLNKIIKENKNLIKMIKTYGNELSDENFKNLYMDLKYLNAKNQEKVDELYDLNDLMDGYKNNFVEKVI